MSKESDFMLGIAFGLLTQVRLYLIQNNDSTGVTILEEEYQSLKKSIDQQYYANRNKEKRDE